MALGKPSSMKGTGKPSNSGGGGGGKVVSVRPQDAVSGGGAPDNVDATITLCRAELWDYNGAIPDPITALHVQFKLDSGETQDQYYSAGNKDRIIPSDDGEHFLQAEGSNTEGLNNNCNTFLFLSALTDKSYPDDRLYPLSSLVGLYGHLNAVAPKKERTGLQNASKPISIFTKIHKMPWEQGKGKGAGAGNKAAASTAKASSNGDSVNEEASEAVMSVLADKGDMPRKKLAMAVYQSIPDSPNRQAIFKLVGTDDFLMQEDAPWQFDGETVSAA